MKRTSFFALLISAALASSGALAGQPDSGKTGAAKSAPTAQHAPLPPGLDDNVGDWMAKPCDDFYRYACGAWIDKTEIPADRSSASRGFVHIAEQNELKLKDILERAAAGKLKKGQPFARQLGDYWATCMDEKKLDSSLPAVKKQLAAFKGLKGKALATTIGKLEAEAINPVFGFGSMQDLKDSSKVINGISSGGLGLPDRDYYLKDDAKTKAVRDAYAAHVAKMFELLGDKPDDAKKKSDTIMAFETRLAKVTLTNVDRRDPEKIYHRVEKAGLDKLAPSFDWKAFYKAMGAPKDKELSVEHPPFFEEFDKIVKDTPPETWETYLSWVYVRSVVPALPKAFQDETFAYTSKALTGAKEDRPRWKKCVSFADGHLGEALGRVFVDENFGADGKARTLGIVKALEGSMNDDLKAVTWMDDGTRKVALEKASKMFNKIGYPDKWRNYASYHTNRKSFLQNFLAGNAFEAKRDLKKIGKPVDKGEWQMTPPTVNAYNDPQLNQIVFPAGILQPPFFNKDATDAVNFGAMGMVVGHEITHGFDDEGRKFDQDGNLRDWWSPEAAKKFDAKTACVVKQFSGYTAIDDIKLKGDLTLGENTADLGGLKISLAAMHKYVKEHPLQKSTWTADQQFFLGYAQSWCSKFRPENVRLRAATDPHSPPRWRVDGPLSNMSEFAAAFGCKAGDKMVRKDRCEIW